MSDELAATPERFRKLTGAPAAILRALLITLTVLGSLWALEVHHHFEVTFFKQQYLALFLALALGSVFIAVKAFPKQASDRIPWYDWLLALGGLAIGLYVTILYPTIAYRLGILSPDRWIFGGLAIILLLEATRRVAGGTLAWLALGVILYTRFAEFMPGIFYSKSPSWARIASYLYLDSNGMLGLPLDVAAGVVVAFILFGQALYAVGGDKFLTDLGAHRHGPLSRRAGQGFGSILSALRYGFRQRSGECGRRRRDHHPVDEANGISRPHGRRHRSGGVQRRPDHAAGHGRRGVFDGGIFKHPLRPSRPRRGGPGMPLLSRLCSLRSIWSLPNAAC